MDAEHQTIDPKIIAEAEAQGWVDKDKYKGDESHWVDAETFVKRGREIMPILRKNNESLLNELKATKEQLKSIQEAASEFRKFQKETHQKKIADLENQIARLKIAKKEALDQGDNDKVVAIDDAISDAKDEHKAAKAQPEPKEEAVSQQASIAPELQDWLDRNLWFGRDVEKTTITNGIGEAIRKTQPHLTGRAFIEELDKRVQKFFGDDEGEEESTGRRRSPVDSSSRERGSRSPKGHSYNDLPPEAKQACDRYVSQKLMTREQYLEDYPWE